ncbi:ABC transporter permease/substrate-binding protein [Streptobacillus moniliformis]|uniref:ABC transporter permease/substrate-binding protein n=1 Tax=Streptobacillus moniliformis TaxID=34105 RepID=UPI0007E47E72|nr:ABC transporter permease/substrate-binding protein [Streptobacillus moniliformis]
MNIINVFLDKKSEWLLALFEHLQISLLSLLIAIIIAVPLGIFVINYKKTKEWLLQVIGIFQTIPSLALLGLFIPFIGIGTLPAVVTLVIYAIFPIMQSTITGLSEIDSSLEEAATAFGMTKWEKLKKYQLALSMGILMSGVRTASIMIIGTATLAALVGAGGLGSFILLGIDRNNTELIFIGAISSAILAIIFGGLIKFLQNKKPKTILMALILSIISVGISFTPLSSNSEKTLVIGGKLGAEPEIIINMYKLLIEEESDINVEIKPNFGKTNFLYEALKSKSIDIYPEYTGTVITTLLKNPIENISNDSEEVYKIARDEIYKQDNLVFLKPSEFQNTYAIAVKKDYGQIHDLNKISDLSKIEKNAMAGFTLEFNDRKDGNKGLKSIYGLNLKVRTMEPSLRYSAINSGNVDIIEIYSTDSKILIYDLKILEDDKKLFPPYQVAPLLREKTLKDYPELKDILEKLSNKISSKEMIEMNYKVDVEGKSAREVAREYLKKENLIK